MVAINKFSLLNSVLTATTVLSAAVEVTDSPSNSIARAELSTGDIEGIIEFTVPNKTVFVNFDIVGLPEGKGPFIYHIHQYPVPQDGNCTGTGGHLNPFNGTTTCNSTDISTCQVGDLSGKHGSIASDLTCFEAKYYDPYLSLNPDDVAYFGNLSVVVHDASEARIACANITLVDSAELSSDDTIETSCASISAIIDDAEDVATASGSASASASRGGHSGHSGASASASGSASETASDSGSSSTDVSTASSNAGNFVNINGGALGALAAGLLALI